MNPVSSIDRSGKIDGMTSDIRVHHERARAESFGQVAQNYDRYRPSYPAALIDDLVATQPTDVLDIGCGTGKAARLLIERGLRVLGVEADARMAEVARANGVAVEVANFEAWEPGERTFDLVTAAQSWHWIDPALGVPKVASLLRPGGVLALFWNHLTYTAPTKADFDAIYGVHAPELLERAEHDRANVDEQRFVKDVQGAGLFSDVEERNYPSQVTYLADEWIGMINTHSDHLLLEPAARAALSAELRQMIGAAGGAVTVAARTYLVRARR